MWRRLATARSWGLQPKHGLRIGYLRTSSGLRKGEFDGDRDEVHTKERARMTGFKLTERTHVYIDPRPVERIANLTKDMDSIFLLGGRVLRSRWRARKLSDRQAREEVRQGRQESNRWRSSPSMRKLGRALSRFDPPRYRLSRLVDNANEEIIDRLGRFTLHLNGKSTMGTGCMKAFHWQGRRRPSRRSLR